MIFHGHYSNPWNNDEPVHGMNRKRALPRDLECIGRWEDFTTTKGLDTEDKKYEWWEKRELYLRIAAFESAVGHRKEAERYQDKADSCRPDGQVLILRLPNLWVDEE
jgi:hypothetical protein